MKYKVTLNNRVYEVEVEQGEAMLVDEYELAAPAAPAPTAVAAPVAAAAPAAEAAAHPLGEHEGPAADRPGLPAGPPAPFRRPEGHGLHDARGGRRGVRHVHGLPPEIGRAHV